MRAGQLRHRVEVYQPASMGQVDDYGQPNGTPTLVTTVWAEVRPVAGGEWVSGQQVQPDVTHLVTLRHSTLLVDLTPAWWLVHQGRRLDIACVRNLDERNRTLVLDCKERT